MAAEAAAAKPGGPELKSSADGVQQRLRRTLRGARATLLGFLAVALVVACWQLTTTFKLVDRLFLPPPLVVLSAFKDIITSSTFIRDLRVSGYEFGVGLGLSILIGGVLGILSGWYKPVEEFLRPIVISLNSVPHLAFIPLLILIFGIGTLPKIILVLLSCVVVMIMNTAAGVENVDPQLMRMSRSFGASDGQVIRTIVAPSVIPFFMTGVRISVGRAVVAVAVAEIFASVAGLGNILITAQSSLNMPVMYAAVVLLTLIGIVLTQAAALLERYMQRWKA
ncbi:MAG TPA: ABC transporter permease [Caulobacteraceae bacterium]|nr:ABC transporter permease [Caulobacteraceae bacterium]